MALWDDLLSYWPCPNVYNYIDTQYVATFTAGVSIGSSGKFDKNWDFAAGSDYVSLATPIPTTVLTGWTVSAWAYNIRPDGNWRDLFWNGQTGANGGIFFGLNNLTPNSELGVYSNNTFFGTGVSVNAVSYTGWHHYASTFDGTVVKFYIDGALVGNCTPTWPGTHNISHINGDTWGSQGLAEKISDPAVWGRELTADEISEIYISNKALTESIPRRQFPDNGQRSSWIDMADNTMLYHMDDASGTDASVNSNTATVSSATVITGKTLASGSTEFTTTLHFNGSSTSLDSGVTPGSVGIDGTNPRTVMLWAKSDAWTANKILFTIGTNSTRQDFSLLAASSNRIQFNAWADDFFSTPPTVEGWNHYALVYDGGLAHDGRTVTLYFNGVYLNSDVMNADLNTSNAHNIKVGAPNYNWTNWNGDIQEFAIFDTNLSASDVLNTYNAQKFLFLGTGSQTAIDLFGSVVHDAQPPTATGINLFGSIVHDAQPPTATGINLFGSVVHDAQPPTATGINLFGSVVHGSSIINSGTVPNITGTVDTLMTFDATGLGISTGSAAFLWSWESVATGSALSNSIFTLPDSGSTDLINMSGNVGLWHFDVTGSSAVYQGSIGLIDTYGDGWHGNNFVTVTVNGAVVLNNITLAAGYGPEWFNYSANNGDTVTVTYTPGSWPTECKYDLNDAMNGAGTTFYNSPTNPTTPYTFAAPTFAPSYVYTTPDSSGEGNDLTIEAATRVVGRVGPYAYEFDGAADWLSGPNTASLEIIGDISIAAWIKADSYSEWEPVIQYAAGSESEEDNNLYSVGWANASGDIRFYWEYGAGTNQLVDFNTSLNTGQWYHMVAVRDAAEKVAHLYIDGTLFESQIYANNPTGGESGSLIIGKDNLNPYYFDGTIDEIAIWNRSISNSEVAAVFFLNSGSCASGSVGVGETFAFTPDVTGTYDVKLTVVGNSPYSEMSGTVSALVLGGVVADPILHVYTNLAEAAWILDPSYSPPVPPPPSPPSSVSAFPIIQGAPLLSSDYTINNFGLNALSGQRMRRVDQVPFRLGVLNTNLAIRRNMATGSGPPAPSGPYDLRVYSTIAEVAWVVS